MKEMQISPLDMVKDYAKKYRGCFDMVEQMRKDRGTILPDWDNCCYIPINATLSILDLYPSADINVFPAGLAALASWRVYKEVYSFSEDFLDLLFEQADDIIVPMEILFNLPYPCVYIKLENCPPLDGYFVHFDYDINDSSFELRFVTVLNDGTMKPYMLHLKNGWTISDGVKDAMKTMYRNAENKEIHEHLKGLGIDPQKRYEEFYKTANLQQQELISKIKLLIQPVLYLCSENTDIVENEKTKSITRRARNSNDKDDMIDKPKDVFREIRHWDTGYRISYAMKQSQHSSDYNSESTGNGSAKRPHARRGHWHHYWRGSGDNKKLILKWTAPMFIHGELNDFGDDGVVTINKV